MAVINSTKNLIEFFMHNYVKDVKIAVDMTVGNGFDSKNILEILKPEKLYCFDIQQEALDNSKKLLKQYSNFELVLENHKNFDKFVKENIDFAMFEEIAWEIKFQRINFYNFLYRTFCRTD